jgi:sulfite reductase (ferredoxin)
MTDGKGPTRAKPDAEELSPVEGIKQASNGLRGDLASELAEPTDHFSSSSVQILKHHGTYQQDDRDARMAARASGEAGKKYIMMVRTRVPGGQLTADQLLSELALCDQFGNGTLRLTSRQALQLHGILKTDLREVIRHIQAVDLSTLAACGDVNRNVMGCPAPFTTSVHQQIQQLAQQCADHFTPRTGAYRDVWLQDPDTGEKVQVQGRDAAEEGGDVEPIYGPTYLPRKFKIGIALPFDNCIDIYANDLGLLAIVQQGEIIGFNVLVGGGMGVTPSNKRTYPALAKKLAFVPPDQVLSVAEAVIKVQRDLGNRSDRKVARLKYTVDRLGIEAFREKVVAYHGQSLAPPHPDDVHDINDHIGWDEQGDGRWFYGLNVENGRVADTPRMRLKSALRAICGALSPGIRLTAHQSVLFTNLDSKDRPVLEAILRDHHVPLSDEITTVRRWSMACVAWPTCGLAITESERALPGIIDRMERELEQWGLSDEAFTVRMTGCPNGCARPYNADIGLVGKAKGRYTILLGGNRLGTRLNFLFRDLVPEEEIVPQLRPLFGYFRRDRVEGESFGDFCHRKGCEDLLAWCEQFASDQA